MNHKTVLEIKSRLAEIEELQRKHIKRDFDAELLKVMTSGGDVDALEQKQLDDERATRRLRVEKQALELELPIATKREGMAEIERLKDARDKYLPTAVSIAKRIKDHDLAIRAELVNAQKALIEISQFSQNASAVVRSHNLERSILDDHFPFVQMKAINDLELLNIRAMPEWPKGDSGLPICQWPSSSIKFIEDYPQNTKSKG